MCQNFRRRKPQRRLFLEKLVQQILTLKWNLFRAIDFLLIPVLFCQFLNNCLIVLCYKWLKIKQQLIKNNTHGPRVNFLIKIGAHLKNLGSTVHDRTRGVLPGHELFLNGAVQTEISHLNVDNFVQLVDVYERVLSFQIVMYDAVSVTMLYRSHNFSENSAGVLFRKWTSLLKLVVQRAFHEF